MNKLTELLNKPILSLYEGELLGNSYNVVIDKKVKQIMFIMFDNPDQNELCCFSPNSIYNVGKNAITIRNKNMLVKQEENEELISAPIGLKVYSIEGEYKGKIDNIVTSPKYKILEIILDNEKIITQKDVISCGKNSLVIGSEKAKVRTNKFFNIKEKLEKLPIIKTEKKEVVPQNKPSLKSYIVQAQFGNAVLLNKTCIKDIKGFSNELIVKKGAKISNNVINIATKHGKLKELLLNCE